MAYMASTHSKKEVIRYIEDQIDAGQSLDLIRQHLLNYGHTDEELNELFDEILKTEETVKSKTVGRAVEILYIIIFVIFIFWVGASSKATGETVILGFFPTLLYIILTIIILEKMERSSDNLLTILPLVLVFFFFIIGSIGDLPLFRNMEVGKLGVLNLILSYIFLFAMRYFEFVGRIDMESFVDKLFARSDKDEEIPIEEKIEEGIMPPEAPTPDKTYYEPEYRKEEFIEINPEDKQSIQKLIQSIESNSKALNQVIGRVYRKSNGGTKLIRELIQVKKDWYNEFNTLVNTMEKDKIIEVIDKIERRLDKLFKSEHEVFGKASLKNLRRDSNGKSRVIDVLIMNDNDPVETYFETALILCGQIKERLR